MKYLSSSPFASKPATDDYRKNYPFGPSKFERELAEEKLAELINRAKTIEMTDDQKEAQRRDWVYGNTKLSNPNITRELVNEVVAEQKTAKASRG